MSATIHNLSSATHAIRECDLPKLELYTNPKLESYNLPYHMYFELDEADSNRFTSLLVAWNDGAKIYLDRTATTVLVMLIEKGASAADLFEMLKEGPEHFEGVYRVVA